VSGEDEKPAPFVRLLMLSSREVDFLIPYLVFAFHLAYGRSVGRLPFLRHISGFLLGGWRRRRNTTQGISMQFLVGWVFLGRGGGGRSCPWQLFVLLVRRSDCVLVALVSALSFFSCQHRRGVQQAPPPPV
jgi:hypothetical protein